MPLSVIRNIVSRRYSDFRGIDLLNAETNVDFRRSPDCLNVWKSYSLSQSNIIQTRPGLNHIGWLGNGNVYSMYFWNSSTLIVHKNNELIKWENFPRMNITVLFSQMNEAPGNVLFWRSYLYIRWCKLF